MQIVSNGLSKPVFWENKKKYQFVVCWISPESGKVKTSMAFPDNIQTWFTLAFWDPRNALR